MLSVEAVVVGPLNTNAYLVCGAEGCVLVDPGGDAEKLLKALGGRRVLAVVATHLHFDHVGAAREVVEATGAPFVVHELDWRLRGVYAEAARRWGFEAPELPEPTFTSDGGELPLGLRVLHTPGHTPGSISIAGDRFALTGDTLFAGSVGRTDLPGGDWGLLLGSVCRLYRELPRSFTVYPGHGPPTTLAREAEGNPVVPESACRAGGKVGGPQSM